MAQLVRPNSARTRSSGCCSRQTSALPRCRRCVAPPSRTTWFASAFRDSPLDLQRLLRQRSSRTRIRPARAIRQGSLRWVKQPHSESGRSPPASRRNRRSRHFHRPPRTPPELMQSNSAARSLTFRCRSCALGVGQGSRWRRQRSGRSQGRRCRGPQTRSKQRAKSFSQPEAQREVERRRAAVQESGTLHGESIAIGHAAESVARPSSFQGADARRAGISAVLVGRFSPS